jgi:hypothetical protein
MSYPRALALIATLACAACTGEIGTAGGPAEAQRPLPGSVDSVGVAVAYAPSFVPRVTQAQYVNSVRDLLGDPAAAIAQNLDLEDPVSESDHTFRTMRATTNGLVDIAAEHVSANAFDVAHAAAGDAGSRTSWLGCTPKSVSDDCVIGGIGALLRRAYRRALSPDEMGKYLTLMTAAAAGEGNDVWKGIEAALAAMLQSPYFLFGVHVGEPDPAARRIRYTSYEMAGRLSLLLWDSVPDAALMTAADANVLASAEGIRAQAERLLADPRARRGVIAFGADFLEADRLSDLKKDAMTFPKFTATLAAAMHEEIEQAFANLVIDQDADYLDVYTTRSTFVNDELAALYGLSPVTGSALHPVTMGADSTRVGLLGSAGFLAVHAGPTEGSIIKRGVFMNERVLCRELGTPPAAAAMNGVESGSTGARTLRERTIATTSRAECTACHGRINPLGFGLESFDGIGGYRTTDNGQPVDASGTLDGASFDGEPALAQAIRSDDAAQHCVAKQLYRYATGHKEDPAEQPHLDQLDQKFLAGGRRFSKLLVDLVAGDGFRYAQPSEVP